LADLFVGQHVHIGEIDAHEIQHTCNAAGKPALRHGFRAFHEQYDIV